MKFYYIRQGQTDLNLNRMPKEENLSNYDMKNCKIIEAEIQLGG